MSGIINQIGAKSGIINTTELDYEEGEYTLASDTLSNFSPNNERYVRIGGFVYIWGGFAKGATTQDSNQFSGVPFTSPLTSIGSVVTNGAGFTGSKTYLAIYMVAGNYYYNLNLATNTGWGVAAAFSDGDEMQFSVGHPLY